MAYDLMADDTWSRTDLLAATFACLNPFYIVLLFSSVGVYLSSHTLGVWLPIESSSAACWYGPALHGGFPVLIGANSFGHLPGSSLITCGRLQSGLADHSVEGHPPPTHLSTWSVENGSSRNAHRSNVQVYYFYSNLKFPAPSSF